MITKTKKQHKADVELELIIEDFGRAMRDAFKPYIAGYKPQCMHAKIGMTPRMEQVWWRYVDWCIRNG